MLNLDDDTRQGLFYGVNSGVLTTMGVYRRIITGNQ